MLGLLGLRIFEATSADIADLGEEHGHRVLRATPRQLTDRTASRRKNSRRRSSPSRILENSHSQEQAPGLTPENTVSTVAQAGESTPENAELPANYALAGQE
jgi:hypothetical protein